MICPATTAPRPDARCWTDEFRLMKLPRRRGSTHDVTIVIAITIRPELPTISAAGAATARASGTRGRFVITSISTAAAGATTR